MATLKNIKSDVCIVLNLMKTQEFPDWIGYNLKVLIRRDNSLVEFLKFKLGTSNSLDNFTTPEVPALYESLIKLTQEDIFSYTFEPIDEKDFCLEIIKNQNKYQITLFFQEATIFDSNQWNLHAMIGLQMVTDKTNIIHFSNELKNEYDSLSK